MLRYISLGAGVQSSVMALMAAEGEFGLNPDVAIFADTASEPDAVYDLLLWLEDTLPFEVVRVTAGSVLDAIAEPSESGFVPVPARMRRADGSIAMGRRQCTREFKIAPIEQEVRRRLGLTPRQRWPKIQVAQCWLGISVDEIERARTHPRSPTIENHYPLLDAGMQRKDLHAWYNAHYPDGPPLPRSSCICCPYRTPFEWLSLTDNEIEEAALAEDAMNDTMRTMGVPEQFLHRKMIPVREAVASQRVFDRDNPTLFDVQGEDGCESGYCFT